MSVAKSAIDIFANPTCVNLLPQDYQNDIIEETIFKAVHEKIRIFRDLDRHIQLSLSFQFKSEFFAKDEIVVKNGDVPSSLGYIHKGFMYGIHPDPDTGVVVKLGPGDFFGEL